LIVTFDFDGTIWRSGFDPHEGIFCRSCGPDPAAIDEMQKWVNRGVSVHVVTSRVSSNRSEVDTFIKSRGDLVADTHFTEGALKSKLLAELGSVLHYDDDLEELENLEPRTRGILWLTGHLDENNNICNPEDDRFHFSNWEQK
tara:strand:+ start:188 stop:616 length:429 start_codon:yes stop_codon:yes gene_type:complete